MALRRADGRSSWPSWSPPCGWRRRTARRPVLTGAAAAAAITLATTVVALPLRAAARERAKNVGLVTQ